MRAKSKFLGSSLVVVGLIVVALSGQIASSLGTKRVGSGGENGAYWEVTEFQLPSAAQIRSIIGVGSLICVCGICFLILKAKPDARKER